MKSTKVTPELLQQVFDCIKNDTSAWTTETIRIHEGLTRGLTRSCCNQLSEKGLIVGSQNNRRQTVLYSIHPNAVDVVDIADWEPSLTAYGLTGRRFTDQWIANHPLVGQIPYGVSEQGVEAMREWLTGADRQRLGRVA